MVTVAIDCFCASYYSSSQDISTRKTGFLSLVTETCKQGLASIVGAFHLSWWGWCGADEWELLDRIFPTNKHARRTVLITITCELVFTTWRRGREKTCQKWAVQLSKLWSVYIPLHFDTCTFYALVAVQTYGVITIVRGYTHAHYLGLYIFVSLQQQGN